MGGASLAVMDKPDSGPKFGADGLNIPLQDGSRTAQSRLGSYYAKLEKCVACRLESVCAGGRGRRVGARRNCVEERESNCLKLECSRSRHSNGNSFSASVMQPQS